MWIIAMSNRCRISHRIIDVYSKSISRGCKYPSITSLHRIDVEPTSPLSLGSRYLMDVLSSSDTSIVEFLLILVESEYGNTDRKPMSFRYQETLKSVLR